MDTIGVALLGLDHWYAAFQLAGSLQKSQHGRLIAVADDDEVRAQQVAQKFGAEVAITDYRALLDRPDVEIIVAMYSTDRHVKVCQEAAAAGKLIVGVKPMALDLASADALVEAVRSAGVHYLPYESTYRLSPEFERIKRWLAEGRIGQPIRYTQVLHSSLPQAWPESRGHGWWLDPARVPGGAWLDHAIYAVDLARWLFGSEMRAVQGVTANLRHTDLPLEDYGHATYKLANGVVATIEDTWTGERGFFFNRSEFIGSAGAILDDSRTAGRLRVRGDFGSNEWAPAEQLPPSETTLVDHLIGCLRGEERPVATVEDARANLAACLAFYQAARAGTSIEI